MTAISKAAYLAATAAGMQAATQYYITEDPREEPYYGYQDGIYYINIPLTRDEIHTLSRTPTP